MRLSAAITSVWWIIQVYYWANQEIADSTHFWGTGACSYYDICCGSVLQWIYRLLHTAVHFVFYQGIGSDRISRRFFSCTLLVFTLFVCYFYDGTSDYSLDKEVFTGISGPPYFIFVYYFFVCPRVAVPICSKYSREKFRAIYDFVPVRILYPFRREHFTGNQALPSGKFDTLHPVGQSVYLSVLLSKSPQRVDDGFIYFLWMDGHYHLAWHWAIKDELS